MNFLLGKDVTRANCRRFYFKDFPETKTDLRKTLSAGNWTYSPIVVLAGDVVELKGDQDKSNQLHMRLPLDEAERLGRQLIEAARRANEELAADKRREGLL